MSINSSSTIGFKVNLFNISLHLSTWLTRRSISFFTSLSFLNCPNNSCDIILIVERGVPNEWAAAAAWPPKDISSCSLEISSCILSKASFLRLDSFPNDKAK